MEHELIAGRDTWIEQFTAQMKAWSAWGVTVNEETAAKEFDQHVRQTLTINVTLTHRAIRQEIAEWGARMERGRRELASLRQAT